LGVRRRPPHAPDCQFVNFQSPDPGAINGQPADRNSAEGQRADRQRAEPDGGRTPFPQSSHSSPSGARMVVDRSLQRADRLNISCDQSDMSPARHPATEAEEEVQPRRSTVRQAPQASETQPPRSLAIQNTSA
jgi:hypothetical protein